MAILGASSVLIGAALFSYGATRSEIEAERASTALRLQLASLVPLLTDTETGQRGYLLTGEEAFLTPYVTGRHQLDTRLGAFEAALGRSGHALPRDLRSLVAQRLALLDASVELMRQGHVRAAHDIVRSGVGKNAMDQIRARFAELDRAIAGRTEALQRVVARRERISSGIAAASALSVIAGLGVGWTLRREVRSQRRASAQREQMLAGLPIGVAVVDAGAREVVYINRAGERMLGDALADVELRRADGSVVAAGDRPVDQALRGETVRGAELLIARAGEPAVPVLVNAVPITLDRPSALLAVIDQTAQKRVEAALRTSLSQLDAVLDNAPVGVAFLEPGFRHVRVNRVLAAITEMQVSDYVGKTFDQIVDPAAAAELTTLATRVRDTREPILDLELERPMVKTPGVRRWWQMSLFPVLAGDDLLGVGIVLSDITKRKRAERELADLNADLERKVAERTETLSRLNGELEAFSYSVSHDLRAPLRAIAGFARILGDDHAASLDPEARALLTRITQAAAKMATLIDDMLELSRISRTEIRREQVDLSALAAAIIGELRDAHPERAADVHIAPGLRVVGDERLLRTALTNLLGNAWKFTARAAAPRIELRAEDRPEGRTYLVSDNGVGFDPQYAHRLFAPFQRLHAQATFEGTGIGLATVQRVIGKHGGRAWIEAAAPERGVTVGFTLGEAAAP